MRNDHDHSSLARNSFLRVEDWDSPDPLPLTEEQCFFPPQPASAVGEEDPSICQSQTQFAVSFHETAQMLDSLHRFCCNLSTNAERLTLAIPC